jgi:uncharacterized repeat protein (TIGR04076 family)
MQKAKITVVKRVSNLDVAQEYMGKEYKPKDRIPCPHFEEGQEFILDSWGVPPEGFCAWAWADIHKYILFVMGGGSYNSPWVEQDGAAIACCTDGYRPVVFKIERIE